MRSDRLILYVFETKRTINFIGGGADMSSDHNAELISELKARFEKNMHRHRGFEWIDVAIRLETQPDKLCILSEMERTGGEPDVVGFDKRTGEFVFYDCSPGSPKGRRSVKSGLPQSSAVR